MLNRQGCFLINVFWFFFYKEVYFSEGQTLCAKIVALFKALADQADGSMKII